LEERAIEQLAEIRIALGEQLCRSLQVLLVVVEQIQLTVVVGYEEVVVVDGEVNGRGQRQIFEDYKFQFFFC
jgi:hypothetical protein